MIIFIASKFLCFALYEMKVTRNPDGEPGMLAIVEGLWYLLEIQNIFVEGCTFYKVAYLHTYMVK